MHAKVLWTQRFFNFIILMNFMCMLDFRAIKTIDALALKIQFIGPSMSISTRNLALGVSSLNSSLFNGSSFSVSPQNNASDFQVYQEIHGYFQARYVEFH